MDNRSHTFETVDGRRVTLIFKNTMRQDIRNRVMVQKFADQQRFEADWNIRSDFIWIISRVAKVDGADWRPVDDTATEDEFEACYYAFTDLVDDDTFYGCVRAVNDLKLRSHPVEKPDSALTAEDAADPN
jgi:hypothetical protein